MPQDYTVGFAFSADRSRILLMRKNRPAWQAGKLNGIGGKINQGEDAADAMCREFFEETGVQTAPQDWQYFSKVAGVFGVVYFYRMFDDKCLAATSCTDEEVMILDLSLDDIRSKGVPNLAWLVGIALDDEGPEFFVEASYKQDFATGKAA